MTKASDNEFPKVILEEVATDGSDTSNPAADHRALFLGEDGGLHLRDSSGTVTDIASAGVADQGEFTYLDAIGASAPATPASGDVRIYAKSDGRIYSKDDTGTEYGPFDAAGGGGGGVQLVIDAVTLDATGDDFGNSALPGWTAIGTGSGSTGATTGYDSTIVDLAMPVQGDGIRKAYPGDGVFVYLTVPRVTQRGGMLALCFTDNSGNGTGMSIYDDGECYMWGLTGGVYSATGNQFGSKLGLTSHATVYRLSRSGATVTGGLSQDGGDTWVTETKGDSTTFTRVAIIRLFTTGGTGCILALGRYNIV